MPLRCTVCHWLLLCLSISNTVLGEFLYFLFSQPSCVIYYSVVRMTVFVGFLERYSELLSFLTSFLMLVVTAIYVYFTRKQAKSAQDAFLATVMHFKESKQPCIVPSIKRVKGRVFKIRIKI